MKLRGLSCFLIAVTLSTNVVILFYFLISGYYNETFSSPFNSQRLKYDKKFVRLEDQIMKNERRVFESLNDIERQLKSSVKRFPRQNLVDSNFFVDNKSFVDIDNSVILEQERRRQRIREVCRKYRQRKSRSQDLDEDDVYRSSIDIFSHKISPESFIVDSVKTRSAYCYNFKSAASTWMRMFAQLSTDESFWRDVSESTQYYKVIYKMSAWSVQNVHEIFDSGDYFTFTVVRHPLDRVLSAYRDRILNGCSSQSRQTVPQLFVELGDDRIWLGTSVLFDRITGCIKVLPTFQEFVRFLVLRPDLHDDHWKSYIRHCAMCLVEYDAIVKLDENSSRDEYFVLSRSGIGRFATFELKNPTVGGKSENVRTQFFSQIPCCLLEELIQLYQMDLEMFDYAVDEFRNVCLKDPAQI